MSHDSLLESIMNDEKDIRTYVADLVLSKEKLQKANRALQAITRLHSFMLIAKDENELVQEICNILSDAGYSLTWIGFLDQETGEVKPVASAGFQEEYIKTIYISIKDSIRSKGPTGKAILSDQIVYISNIDNDPDFRPWLSNAKKHGFRSVCAIPLHIEGKSIGSLNLYSAECNAFSSEELALLQRMADDLCYGFETLIIKQLHEKEKLEKEVMYERLLQIQKLEMMGTMAGGVAHDFNNLLNVIIGYTQLVMRKFSEDDPASHDLKEIEKAARQAASITGQLLLMGRNPPASTRPIAIDKLIEEQLSLWKKMIHPEIQLNLISHSFESYVAAERIQLSQVLMNLIVNAGHAITPPGSIQISTSEAIITHDDAFTMPQSRAGHYVCISVADSGEGMDKETIKRIFDPFFTTRLGKQGTGLGLSVSLSIVTKFEGWIHVESEKGKGSIFKIYLPVKKIDENISFDPEEKKTISNMLTLNGKRVLLVEDEESLRKLTTKLLTESGLHVISVPSGEDALQLFMNDSNFDILFSDVVLREKDGFELAKELLAKKPDLGIILCSGYTDKKNQIEEITGPRVRFIQKPYYIKEIIDLIMELLTFKKHRS